MVVMTEPKPGVMQEYVIEYLHKGTGHTVFSGTTPTQSRVKIHRFDKLCNQVLFYGIQQITIVQAIEI